MFMPSGVVAAAATSKVSETAEYLLTAGDESFPPQAGFFRGEFGSITPDEPYNGHTINALRILTAVNDINFIIDGVIPNDDFAFIRITLSGVFINGQDTKTLLRTDATFEDSLGDADWSLIDFTDHMISGNTYNLSIDYKVSDAP